MSLLSERSRALNRLNASIKTLLEAYEINGKIKAQHKVLWDKKNVIEAKKQLYNLERKLCKINHAGHPKVEMYARLMLIFKPDLKAKVEELMTFT